MLYDANILVKIAATHLAVVAAVVAGVIIYLTFIRHTLGIVEVALIVGIAGYSFMIGLDLTTNYYTQELLNNSQLLHASKRELAKRVSS